MLSVAGDRKPADLDVVVGTLPRQDSNLRPVDKERARPRATHTVPTEKERDG